MYGVRVGTRSARYENDEINDCESSPSEVQQYILRREARASIVKVARAGVRTMDSFDAFPLHLTIAFLEHVYTIHSTPDSDER